MFEIQYGHALLKQLKDGSWVNPTAVDSIIVPPSPLGGLPYVLLSLRGGASMEFQMPTRKEAEAYRDALAALLADLVVEQ